MLQPRPPKSGSWLAGAGHEEKLNSPPMCGRYSDTKRKKALLATVGLLADVAFTPRYNIAPTQEASIVRCGCCWLRRHLATVTYCCPVSGVDEGGNAEAGWL